MGISKASAKWEGSLKDGKGSMTPAHAASMPFSFGSRFEGQPATNPEEFVGAALSGCFSMALSVGLGAAGFTPTSIDTRASVKLEKLADGFAITGIELVTEAVIPGIDAATFDTIAEQTKKGCPVSKALAGTVITLTATLLG